MFCRTVHGCARAVRRHRLSLLHAPQPRRQRQCRAGLAADAGDPPVLSLCPTSSWSLIFCELSIEYQLCPSLCVRVCYVCCVGRAWQAASEPAPRTHPLVGGQRLCAA